MLPVSLRVTAVNLLLLFESNLHLVCLIYIYLCNRWQCLLTEFDHLPHLSLYLRLQILSPTHTHIHFLHTHLQLRHGYLWISQHILNASLAFLYCLYLELVAYFKLLFSCGCQLRPTAPDHSLSLRLHLSQLLLLLLLLGHSHHLGVWLTPSCKGGANTEQKVLLL
jgi:hypothetical protein